MARVDYQQVVERLLALAASKPNIGQRELLGSIGRFIEEATVPEDQYAAFLGRFGEEIAEAVLGLLPPDQVGIPPRAAPHGRTSGDDQPTSPDGDGGTRWKQQRTPVLT